MPRCEFCGAPLEPEEKKCSYCGTAVPKPEKKQPSSAPKPPLGRTAESPVWNNNPAPPPRSSSPRNTGRSKRTPGCLIAFVACFILINFFIIVQSLTGSVFSMVSLFTDHTDVDIEYSIPDEVPDVSSEKYPAEYEDWYKPGMYKVGVDISAGVYRVDALDGDGYFSVCSDSSGKSSSILFNDIFDSYVYILLEDGQYLTLSRSVALESKGIPAAQPEDGVFSDGTFRIGVDIPAGEYKIVGTSDDSYYRLMGTPQCEYDKQEFITADYVESAVYQTLEDGQYLTLEGGAYLTVSSFPEA